MVHKKLDPIELLYAYANGYFPMAHEDEGNEIYWHRPDMRGIIPLDQFHLSKNMRRLYRKTTWRMTHNTSFEQVIRACSNRETTWISEEIIEAYVSLHKQGHARSVEVWEGDELVGGLYGIEMKRAFFGESMFSTRTNASKLALVHLVEFLMTHSFILLDTQYLNDHIAQFGGVEIPDENYMALLGEALSN